MRHSISRHVSRQVRRIGWWLLASLLLTIGLNGGRTAVAQTANASISGRITDPTSALISNATVILTDTDTHIAIKATSNGQGMYVFPSVRPGKYSMSVSRTGFHTITITGLTAEVEGSLTLRDVVLEIGSASETVTVTAEAADETLERASSELGTEIAEEQIHDLPLNGRNFTQLLTLTPGASPIMTSQAAQAGVGVNDQAVLGIPEHHSHFLRYRGRSPGRTCICWMAW